MTSKIMLIMVMLLHYTLCWYITNSTNAHEILEIILNLEREFPSGNTRNCSINILDGEVSVDFNLGKTPIKEGKLNFKEKMDGSKLKYEYMTTPVGDYKSIFTHYKIGEEYIIFYEYEHDEI